MSALYARFGRSFCCVTPSSLMLLFIESVYCSRGMTVPVTNTPDENPPRTNSPAICRSLAAQYGHDPCTERAVRFGKTPTPITAHVAARYCRFPNSIVCCVVGSDQSEMLYRNFGS